jgi:hypothetical protein
MIGRTWGKGACNLGIMRPLGLRRVEEDIGPKVREHTEILTRSHIGNGRCHRPQVPLGYTG